MSCNNLPPDTAIVELDEALGLNFYTPPLPPEPPNSDTGRRVHLTWTVSRYNYNGTDGIRVRIEADSAEDMPRKIFAYLMLPLKPGEDIRAGAFDHVCSPTDLEEYPEDEPIPDHRPEFFRLDYVDVVLRSRTEVHAFVRDVAADVYQLKRTLDLMDHMLPGGEIWIGGEPASSSSSLSSNSG
jgi:hypothetical protein